MKDELSLREIFILLPRLMLLKDKKKISEPITVYNILKVLDLNPHDGNYCKMVRKWGLPKYLFIKKIKETREFYTIEDKTFWKWFWNHQPSMNIISFIRTKATVIE